MKNEKLLLASVFGIMLLSSGVAFAAEEKCSVGVWELPYRKTICYSQSMEQYMCVRDGNEMKLRFVQKLSLKSSLKDVCYIVDESFLQRPADNLIVK